MANYFIGWELGGGLGHAGRLKPLAAGLMQQGHQASLWLRDLVQTRALLADLPCPKLQAPVWMHRTVGVPEPQASMAEILLGCGYLQAEHLDALVGGWLAAMRTSGAEAVVVDYSPTALLAARIAGLPAASVGMGFWLPPRRTPIPAFRDWEPLAPGRVERAEAQVLTNVNQVLSGHGVRPLEHLWQLFGGNMPLLCSWPELDHYGRSQADEPEWLGPNFLPSAGGAPSWPAGDGPRVFAYLRSAHPDSRAVLQALLDAGTRVLCYLPEVNAGLPKPVSHAMLSYASGPVDMAQTLGQVDLLVNHAGQATVAQGLLAGVPQLLLPMQAEQFVMARQVQRSGAGVNAAQLRRPANYVGLVRRLLAPEASERKAAQVFSKRHEDFSHEGQVQQLLQRLLALPNLKLQPG